MSPQAFLDEDVFVIPVREQLLLYAPLKNLAALVNHAAIRQLENILFRGKEPGDARLDEIAHILRTAARPPQALKGDLSPAFLGLLPTRECNLGCRYCGFRVPDDTHQVMDLRVARDAVDWYMNLVSRVGQSNAEIHFFGGEPFCAPEVLDLTVHLARIRAQERGCTVCFEVATNGALSEERCRWAADNLDTVVLSLDGPPDIHDYHRPYKDGRGSSRVIDRSAKILSQGPAEFFVRSCVTSQSVDRMPEIAEWLCRNYHPQGVCFEPVQPVCMPGDIVLEPPDPWAFVRGFVQAAGILEAHSVAPIYAAADICARRVSFCPVGQDVIIVAPDGALCACYLLHQDWEARGLDLCLGRIQDGEVMLDMDAVAFARGLNVQNKPACARCFCKWHCAGGCHVNHQLADRPGSYDRLCVQTRIITLRNILQALGREDLVQALLSDDRALERIAWQRSDAFVDVEEWL